jgi:lipopolysaccharide transport system permease protein
VTVPQPGIRARTSTIGAVTLGRGGFELRGGPTPAASLVREVWGAHRLIGMLARQDFYVRYRRAAFGLVWAVGLPVFQATVLSIVFSYIVRVRTGTSYPVFMLSGLVPWTFFSLTLSVAATAIVDGSSLSTKIYFPRAVLPLVSVAANVYGFVISLAVLVGACLVFGVGVGPRVVLLLPATLLLFSLTAAFALLGAALHVYFRDIRYVIQASLTAWFYLTPVFYPLRLVPGGLRHVIEANPLTGVVGLFREATVGGQPRLGLTLLVSMGWLVLASVGALEMHRRYDRVFVDLL